MALYGDIWLAQPLCKHEQQDKFNSAHFFKGVPVHLDPTQKGVRKCDLQLDTTLSLALCCWWPQEMKSNEVNISRNIMANMSFLRPKKHPKPTAWKASRVRGIAISRLLHLQCHGHQGCSSEIGASMVIHRLIPNWVVVGRISKFDANAFRFPICPSISSISSICLIFQRLHDEFQITRNTNSYRCKAESCKAASCAKTHIMAAGLKLVTAMATNMFDLNKKMNSSWISAVSCCFLMLFSGTFEPSKKTQKKKHAEVTTARWLLKTLCIISKHFKKF